MSQALRRKFLSYIKKEYDYKTDLLIFSNEGKKEMPDIMVFHNKKQDVVVNTEDCLKLEKVEVVKYAGIAFFIGQYDKMGFFKKKAINLLGQNTWLVCIVDTFEDFKRQVDNYMKLKTKKEESSRKERGIDYFLE